MNPAFLPYAYILGLSSLISPCVAVTVPALMAHAQGQWSRVVRYMAGFAASVFSLVMVTLVVGRLFTSVYGSWAYLAGGILTGLAGLSMLGVFPSVSLFPGGRGGSSSLSQPFLSGAVLGGVSLTCVGPSLAALFGLALTMPDAGSKVMLSLVFVVGSITPFFLYGYAVSRPWISQRMAGHASRIHHASAWLMLAMSAFMVSMGLLGVTV